MIYTHVLNRGPAGVRSPADRMFPVMTSAPGITIGRGAAVQLIARRGSRSITARDRTRALQGRANAGADGTRPGPFAMLYRPMHPNIAVQDTKR
jgi:hypothetical protein